MDYFIDDDNKPYYDRDATEARYLTPAIGAWYSATGANTQFQNYPLILKGHFGASLFIGQTAGGYSCGYNGTKTTPDNTSNLYQMSFDVTQLGGGNLCDHLGTGFTGVVTIVDGDGGVGSRVTDGTMWFAATNGQYATFGVPFYFAAPP